MHHFQVHRSFLSLLAWPMIKTKALFFFSLFRLYCSQPQRHLRANKVFSVQFIQQETTHKLSLIKPISHISVWIWDVLESSEKTPILVTNHTFCPPAAHFHYSFLIIRSNWVRENPPRTGNTSRLDLNMLVLIISFSALLNERRTQ